MVAKKVAELEQVLFVILYIQFRQAWHVCVRLLKETFVHLLMRIGYTHGALETTSMLS